MNEHIFIIHTIILSTCALLALRLGKEALVAFVCLQGILANLFVTKQITLLQWDATSSDAYSIGAVLGLNLLQEYYGKEVTKKTIWISFFTLLLYMVASLLHMSYVPCRADTMHEHFVAILGSTPRIVITSLLVYLTVQMIDTHLYGMLKRVFNNRFLALRYCLSVSICQLLDTILFSLIGLYGLVDNMGHIIIVSYAIKLVAIAIGTPFVAVSRSVR